MRKATRFIVVSAATALLFTAISSHALAKGPGGAKGSHSGGSSGTLTLVLLNSTDGVAHWGQQVTFTVSTTATNRPFVSLACSQGGAQVYAATAGMFDSYTWSRDFTLKSSMWPGGAADCTATLYYFTSNGGERTLGTMGFPVYA